MSLETITQKHFKVDSKAEDISIYTPHTETSSKYYYIYKNILWIRSGFYV